MIIFYVLSHQRKNASHGPNCGNINSLTYLKKKKKLFILTKVRK